MIMMKNGKNLYAVTAFWKACVHKYVKGTNESENETKRTKKYPAFSTKICDLEYGNETMMIHKTMVGTQNSIMSNNKVPNQYGALLIPITNDMYLNFIYLSATILPQNDDVLKL